MPPRAKPAQAEQVDPTSATPGRLLNLLGPMGGETQMHFEKCGADFAKCGDTTPTTRRQLVGLDDSASK